MNRRSFFWFLPALPAAFLTKPAEVQVVAGMDMSSATNSVTITNCHIIDSRTDRAGIIATMRESERITLHGIRGMERWSGHTLKIT